LRCAHGSKALFAREEETDRELDQHRRTLGGGRWALDAGTTLEDAAALGGDLACAAGSDEAEQVARDLSDEALSVGADVELDSESDREIAGEPSVGREQVCEMRSEVAVCGLVALLALVDQVHRIDRLRGPRAGARPRRVLLQQLR